MPKRYKPTEINGKPITDNQEKHIYDEWKIVHNKGESYEQYVKENERVLDMMFVTPAQQMVSASNNYTFTTALIIERNGGELRINNKVVNSDQFNSKLDEFENFVYSNYDGIANIRYYPHLTLHQNVFGLILPSLKELKQFKNESLDELIKYLDDNGFKIDIYNS